MGHGLQKLVSPRFAPKFLAANGPRGTGGFFDQAGMRPGILLAVLAGLGELVGGFSIAAGLLTPVGTVLLAAAMTVAMLNVPLSKGIWSSAGGFEFPLLMLTAAYVVSAIGPGSLSIASAADANAFTATQVSAPPTLTRCAPASTSSAIVRSGRASTLTGCETASQTALISSRARSPGA